MRDFFSSIARPIGQPAAWLVLFAVLLLADRASAQTWNSPNLFANWTSMAMSGDGTEMAAAAYGGDIFTSTDGGNDWSDAGFLEDGMPVLTASTDGSTLVAAFCNGNIYTSTNWGGLWTTSAVPTNDWSCLASSSNGSQIVAGTSPGLIYISTNSGATFTSRLPNNNGYQGLAGAIDGSVLVAIAFGGGIYRSTDVGDTWVQTAAPVNDWIGVAASTNGVNFVAAVQGGGIYTSPDSGVTWNLTSAPTTNWSAVASSVDGTHLAAAVNGGLIYTSTDGGNTWNPANVASNTWSVIYVSPDGTRLVALANHSGNAYVSSDFGNTWSQPLIASTSGTTNFSCTASYSVTVIATNASSHAVSVSNYQTNFVSGKTTVSVPVLSFTNLIGFKLAKATVAKTTKASLLSLMGINVAGNKIIPVGAWHTNLLGTNQLGINVKITQAGKSNIVSGKLAVPALGGFASTNLTNVLTASVPGISVIISNVFNLQVSTVNTSQQAWSAIAGSADGTHLFASSKNGVIYSSVNSGTNWFLATGLIRTATNSISEWQVTNAVPSPNQDWAALNVSADGSKLFAAVANGGVFSPVNSGVTWQSNTVPWQIQDGEIPITTTTTNIPVWQSQGQIWVSNNVPVQDWSALFESADGNTLVAVARYGWVYKSTNAGTNWTELNSPFDFWQSIASSASGAVLLAASHAGYVYESTNAGATWTPENILLATNLTMVDTLGLGIFGTNAANHTATNDVFTSTSFTNVMALDSSPVLASNIFGLNVIGATVTNLNHASVVTSLGLNLEGNDLQDFTPISTNFIGTNIVASGTMVPNFAFASNVVASVLLPNTTGTPVSGTLTVVSTNILNVDVFTSTVPHTPIQFTNKLTLMVAITNLPQTWSAVAVSADGSHQVVAVNGGFIYASADSGVTWNQTSAPQDTWSSLAMSSDGSQLIAGTTNDVIYSSGDSGATWQPQNVPGADWTSVVMSSDGTVQGAVIYQGLIYTGSGAVPAVIPAVVQAPSVSLQISVTNGNVLLAWPATGNYSVLTASDPGKSWQAVSATVVQVNGTNEVTLPMTNQSSFYRLKQ